MKFRCLRCGYCCRNLIYDGAIRKGLLLLPSEVHLFPTSLIKPSYGAGKKGKSRPRPRKIIAYQYARKVCIHLKNNLCGIYYQRPLACRGYPLSIYPLLATIDDKCRFFNGKYPIGMDYRKVFTRTEIESNMAINMYLSRCILSEKYSWTYCLRLNRWISIEEEMKRFSHDPAFRFAERMVKDVKRMLRLR